ncbi:DUF6262 family protein [Streptomyces sp. NBC_01478]|uniref:DUF6262 family protein n=1 Tax=Streptomyces sp. NBC_01478 TaxID=2903882 RepID=UPI002E330338|nr:DUF6262 family protein [Streptomyces sp. NBC_01478]
MAAEATSRAPAEVLKAARQRDSAAKRGRVLKTVQDMIRDGERITFALVARRAEVSSWLVYAPGVREHIDQARTRQAAQPVRAEQSGVRASKASEQTDLILAREEIKRLRAQVAELREGLQHHLGRQLDHLGSQDLATRITELSQENVRLAVAEREVAATNRSLEQKVTQLEDDLAAARTSLRRMIREQNA